MDHSVLERDFAPVGPWPVEAERVAAFAAATQFPGEGVPPTYPIILLNQAMLAFLGQVGAALEQIVHGEQRFTWHRPVVIGDVLSATMKVASLRMLGGAEVIGTITVLTDANGLEVGQAKATLVHGGAA